jgi:hypothetical protein
MEMDDLMSGESAVVAAAVAAVASPGVRRVVRRGAVYGVAGIIKAADAVSAAVRGAAGGVKDAAQSQGGVGETAATQASGRSGRRSGTTAAT